MICTARRYYSGHQNKDIEIGVGVDGKVGG